MLSDGSRHTGHGEEEASVPGAQVGLVTITRRRFLGVLSGLASGAIAAALGLPLARFYIGNAFRPRPPRWMKLGLASEVRPGEPRLFTVGYVDQDGWRETTSRQEVYVVTEDGSTYATFSNICTHLGCPVHWDDTKRVFLCPCHGGQFGLDGRVRHGPPPRPLAQVAHKVEQGTIYVRVGD